MINMHSFRRRLARRAVEFNQPVNRAALVALRAMADERLDAAIENLYSSFDGLYDPTSLITIWPLARVLGEAKLSLEKSGRRFHAIGDVLIDSDIIMCCLEDTAAPLWLRFEDREIATSLIDLMRGLAEGRYDLPTHAS